MHSSLLPTMATLLRGDATHCDYLDSLVSSAPCSDLLYAFTALADWLTSRPALPDRASIPRLQFVLRTIRLIGSRIPPAQFRRGVLSFTMVSYKPNWLLHPIFAPLTARMSRLAGFRRPFGTFGSPIVRFPPPFDYTPETVVCNQEHIDVLEKNPSYRLA
jgi:hypothetical protein